MKIDRQAFTPFVEQHYISYKEHPEGGLFIYNYTPKAQYESMWTPEILMSRGLITDTEGNIVARPFDKFFNWLEGDRRSDAQILSITEKLDGSLGILYQHNGKYRIATRGSFTGEQAIWATEYFNQTYSAIEIPQNWTLLFEIIYPSNRIVVDYGSRSELVLLAIRRCDTGQYLNYDIMKGWAEENWIPIAAVYEFSDIGAILEQMGTLSANNEGYVVSFSDGQRFKFKGTEYLRIHRLVTNLSFKRVLEAVANGSYADVVQQIPDEFMGQVKLWKNEIDRTVWGYTEACKDLFNRAPKDTQKEFALWVQANATKQVQSWLFAMKSGKDILPLIYKVGFENRQAADKPLVENAE